MNAIIDMATDLKAKGIIDGIGMQSHLDVRSGADAFPSVDVYNNALDKYSELGLDIQVTELDATTENNPTEKSFETQAEYFKGVMDSIYAHKDNISAVIIWGIKDDTSWRADRCPLLFDADYKAKPAFYSIIEGREIPEQTSSPATSTGTENTLLGDANEDGTVNMADATAIIQHIGNQDAYGLSAQGIANANLCDNLDGITGMDAVAIQLLVAKQINKLPYVE